ncbi:PXPV repeat protein [Rhodoferax sp.]|uniref:PXPV repeat protein n=1 Tax=Rhodoferax sp. TaxID=50421 RepID=UPI0025FE48A4|nr:PXPV repeat protein [Rhodoferax sp.]MCM2296227.1 hypothetical protein [Rhodoferax sp.]
MKHLISPKSMAAVALALGAFAAASSAHARSDVYFSIGVQVPGVYVQPAPVYVQPAPVYIQPAPVYVQPRPVFMPVPGHYQRFDNGRHYGWQNWQRRGSYGDRDHDGIMNRWDRDRDGDGVRNRYDRLPDNPYRR